MTIKELKEELQKYPEDTIVEVLNEHTRGYETYTVFAELSTDLIYYYASDNVLELGE